MKIRVFLGCVMVAMVSHGLFAKTDAESRKVELRALTDRLKYQQGQIHLKDGLADINLADTFRYVDPAGTEVLLTGIWGNPPSGKMSLGMIVPSGFDPLSSNAWCVIINYQEDGYVKDNDAEKINYPKLLTQMQDGTRQASTERVKNGYPPIELVGWATPPRYDKQTHKFYWAKELKFGETREENTLNYNLRILGRKGILVLNAVSSMSQFPQIEQATPELLGMIDFNAGNRYADYTPGVDKMATYGLAALVAGGIAAKAGLFKGLLLAILALKKFLIIGVIAIIAFVKKIIYGRSRDSSTS